jgi:hypothetical protein
VATKLPFGEVFREWPELFKVFQAEKDFKEVFLNIDF